jgi:hypothetical protein
MKTKFNLDRDKLNSDYINSKQDYKRIMDGFEKLKPPIWKNPWFYGPVGLASLAVILVITFQSRVNAYGNNSTLNNTSESTISLPEDTPCIKAPISDKDIAYQVIDVLPEKGLNIELESGTSISIPANSLKSEKGAPVQVKIREFHDKASAFLAGIPMDYSDNSAFESAGMIEIRAEKDGKSISLDKTKPMSIDLAMNKTPEGFQFWKLDESKKEWIETPCAMKPSAKASPKEKLMLVESKISQQQEKIEICENKIANIAKTSNTTVNNNLEQSDFPELEGYKDIEFEYLLPSNRSEANLQEYGQRIKYAQTQIWNDMDIKKQGDHYLATFINSKEKYTLPIRPVLKGKSLEEMQAKMASASVDKSVALKKLREEKMAYEQEQAKLKRDQELLNAQLIAQIKRGNAESMESRAREARDRAKDNQAIIQQGTASFRTTSFGVFNCDKPIPYPPGYSEFLAFETQEGVQIQMENAFVFDTKKDTRYSFGPYYMHKSNDLGWFNHESTLIILDPKGDVYYRKNVNDLSKSSNKVVVKHLDKKALNLDDIQKIISETTVTV